MFPLFELVRILDLENLYQIPVHGTNAIDHTEQAIDVLAPPDIKLFATTNCAERSLLAILCSDGSLVVHYCAGAAPAVVRRLEWNLDMLSEVVAMTFDPSGTWLLCAVQTAGIYILPILSAMDPGVKINQMWNLKDVTEILKYKGTKAQPTSVAWWNTLDDIHVGIIANKLGEVTFVDLVKGKELCGTYIPEEIEQMELYTNNEQTTTYLLLTSCVGAQWKLLLERKLESSPRRSFAEKFNFFVRHRTSECILGVSDSHPRFLPVKMQDDGGNVFTAYAKSRYLLAKQNFKDGLLRMYDGIEQEAPVFIYRVPKDCGKVLVTDHLLFTLADDTVLVLSNQQSESYTEAKQSFKEESKVQQFSTSQMGKDLKIVRRNYPFYLHKQREHARLQEMGRTVPGEASSAKQQVGSADIMLTLKEKCDKKARGLTKKITVPPNTPNRASPDATVPLQPAKADDNVVFHVHIDEAEVAECADMEHIDDVAQAIATGNLGIIRRSSSSEDMGAVIEGAFDSLPLIALEHHTVFTGCLIVGRRAVYECRPRISPERMFLDLTIDNYDIDVTELLGISLGLDLYLLYELAGDFYLEQGQFCHAIYLYQVSKSPYVRVIYNFVKHNHIGKILAYVSNLLSNSKMYMTLVDREQLANIALLCFTHEVIDHQSRSSVWLETSFREFLNTTSNYDCQLALELLSRYAMYDLLFLLAKRCGLMPQMLQLLSSQGHMRTDDTDVYDDTHALVVVPESLIHCMTTSDVVMQLLALPQAALQYMQLVVSQVALLDEDTLLHLALQFDPSRAAMKPFLSRAVQHRKRTMDGSMSSVASETVIDFVGAEREPTTATARELCVEDAIEFYLTVLLALVAQQRRRFGRSAGAKTLRFDATFAHAGDGADKELIERDTVIVSCQPVSVAAGHSHSAVVVAGELYTWGKTDRERLGHKNTQGVLESPQRVYKLIGLDVIAVSCGNAHTVALTNTGVYTWGSDTYGQLGLGMNETGGPPRIVQALAHVQCVSVVCGQYHTLALTSTGRVYSWGWGVHGQLGHGTADDCHLPTYIRALEGVVVTTVCAGYAHSAILDEMGQVFTFGCGAYGQLGLGPAISMKLTTPTLVPLPEPCSILSSGFFHNVAVAASRRVWSWGCSPQAAALRATSARREAHRARAAAAAARASRCDACQEAPCTCAASDGGAGNDETQRERSDSLDSEASQDELPFVFGSPATNLATLQTRIQQAPKGAEEESEKEEEGSRKEEEESKKETANGDSKQEEAKEEEGEDTFSHMVPTPLEIHNVIGNITQISCGNTHSAILSDDGALYLWGKNMDGQLGTGDRKSQIVPTRELCLIDRKIEHVACGSDFTVVIDMDGKVWAWGRNENGEVGHPPRAESQPFIRLPPGAQNVMVKTNRRVISIPSRAINLRLGVLKPQHVPDVPEIPPLHRQEGERGLIHLELPRLPHDLDDEHWASILRQTLQRLWGLYDRDRVQDRCVEQDLWDSASDVAALRGDLPLALQYRLTALEQMPPERAELTTVACLVVQHYIRNCVEADGVDEMGLPAPPDWLQLLEAALKFWLTHKLPLSDLETTLRSQLDTLAPSLAIYIIRGIDMPDGAHVRLDRQLSDTFCLDVVAAVAQQIQQGQLSTPLVKQIVGDGDDDDSAKSPPAAKQDGGGRVTSAAPPVTADRLWTEVMTSLRIQPGGAAQHVALSAADVERLRRETDGSDADDRQVALFSCGHNFARRVFADAVLGKLERSLQGNAHVPAQTAQLIVSMYKAPGFVPLACPDCVLRELEQGSLETRM